MAIVTTRDQFALAISGQLMARCIRPQSSDEEIDLIAKAIWKAADAMVRNQQKPAPCQCGGHCG